MKNNGKHRILVVDDSPETLELFRHQLAPDYHIQTAESLEEARKLLNHFNFHIAIIDLILPGENGLDLIQEITQNYPYMAVIAISGQATIESAVQAMKLGANEFITKPIRNLDLINLQINKILQTQWLIEENQRLNELIQKDIETDLIIGNSPSIQNLLQKVKKIAKLDATVMITGETGVGKSVFAELIHRNSHRKLKKFVSVNCGSLTETLLESLLFGHKKGAFTDAWRDKIGYFQEASGGTLFLDEITETSLSFQVKLLKVLETGIFRQVGSDNDMFTDLRIIAATNKDISELVVQKLFREDLYYRLNVINLHISPLRERKDDIKILSSAFVREFCAKYKKDELTISPGVMSILLNHDWKGNVRELRNALEHAVILAEHSILQTEDLPENLNPDSLHPEIIYSHELENWHKSRTEFEKRYFTALLDSTKGNLSQAARISEIERVNIYKKCRNLGIDPQCFRKGSSNHETDTD
ncbi:MAG: sigma-54 dependent transcriptional regulator [Candidatus Cloacimonetes bacterium]|nr:sigma-54 dependent transcriptional regulator [Candidatus Cloacimonadota bacterium]